MTNLRQLLICWLASVLALAPAVQAASQTDRYDGWLLRDVIEDIRERAGIDVVYSSNFIGADTRVATTPHSAEPLQLLREVLRPHGLTLRADGATYYVVRDTSPGQQPTHGTLHIIILDAASQSPLPSASIRLSGKSLQWNSTGDGQYTIHRVPPGKYRIATVAPAYREQRRSVRVEAGLPTTVQVEMWPSGPLPMENIVVSTSRYRMLRDPGSTMTSFDAEALQIQPNIGDDPLRMMRRLPGAASGGLSAQVHLRGGEKDETLLVLNGLELVDPFHLRDYQSLFSAIDRRILSDVDVYTGGFPASYGDALSGVISMRSIEPVDMAHELSLSFFNAGGLSSGTFADGDGEWLVSARRGNLDLVVEQIDDTLGKPRYRDAFAHVRYQLSDKSNVMFNVFNAADDVYVVAEPALEDREEATSDSENTHLWAGIENEWTQNLHSLSIVSHTRVDNTRSGFAIDREAVIGSVNDQRDFTALAVKQDWTWWSGKRQQSRWGWQWATLNADYDYRADAEFFGLQSSIAGNPDPIDRSGRFSLKGEAFSAYLSHRLMLSPIWLAELGLRWDRQTYTPGSNQWSPRINLLYRIHPQTDLRLSAGRFFQSQQIHDLQVEDGVDTFFPAERADQLIIGIDHRFENGLSMRVEAYQKRMDRLLPRYENVFDPLVILPELAPDRVRVAPDSATLRGLELSFTFDNGGSFGWSAGYTLSRATDEIDGTTVARSWDQRHALNAGFTWQTER